jgi:hypothetical protein
MSGVGFDPSLLFSYYQAQLAAAPSNIAAGNAQNGSVNAAGVRTNSATANDQPPWENPTPAQNARDAQILSTTNFLNTSNVPVLTPSSADAKTEQDNQKLFSLYTAVNNVSYLASMAQRGTTTSGQLAGLNARFQAGLSQIESYISTTKFNNFTLQAAAPAASVTSTATIPFSDFSYSTRTLTSNANLNNALPSLNTGESFNIGITKGGTTTNVAIDLSQVQGPLTLGNVIIYVNQQLSADGFSTRFQKTTSGGTATDDSTASYGLQITPGANETVNLSSADATPSLYLAGNTGTASETTTTVNGATSTTPPDQQGRLIKISGADDGNPQSTFSVTASPTTGNTTASDMVTDSSGNVYVVGSATGNIGQQINQGIQDVYLTKYDSAGNVLWSNLVGSAGSATGYSVALNPKGGVVVAGSTTADLTTTAIADGNTDTFVASYDSSGDQNWVKQIQTLAQNQPASVSVDANGNIFVGGSVGGFPVTIDGQTQTLPGGVIGSGQTAQGGTDAYLAKLDSKGNVVSENQFGTSGTDQVSATATTASGDLIVASVQNGQAIISKYAGGDISSTPVWTQNLGALQNGGSISGLTVSGSQVYVSGTTQNGNLTAGGAASVANASSGGQDAFVFNLTDNGTTATPDYVSYVGTSGTDQGGNVAVGSNGTVYLTGSTTGTFAGQQRSVQNSTNAFAAALNPDGSVAWTRQYGGLDGTSTGAGIDIDPNGSSVLDALGLPHGTVTISQSVDLTTQTSLRAGDSFQIQLQGVGARTATITIDAGETISSLATKINAQLGGAGKAAANYTGSAEGLKITANPGSTFTLVAGPSDFNALSRLGIAAGTLTAPAAKSASGAAATKASATTTPSFGLGLTGNLDISTKTGADLARSTLLGVLSKIQNAYQTSNAPPPSTSTTPGNQAAPSATISAYQQNQLGNYNLALSLLGPSSNSSSGGSLLSLF